MSKNRSKTLVVIYYRNLLTLLPASHKFPDTLQILARLTVRLPRLSYNNKIHLFRRDIPYQIVIQFRCRYRSKPPRDYLHSIRNGKPRTLLTIVYRQNTPHSFKILFAIKKPSVRILTTELSTTLHSFSLCVKCRGDNTIHLCSLIVGYLSVISLILQLSLHSFSIYLN